MTGLLLLLAIGFAVYAAFLVVSTLLTLQYPPRRTYAWAVSRKLPGDPGEMSPPLDFERFEFTSRGRKLIAWDIKGLRPDGPLIVLTHGWSDSKVGSLARVHALAPMASRLIAWDLPGHGEAEGACEMGLNEPQDLLRLLDAAGSNKATPIVLMGWSLGAGVSLVAAAKLPIAGVIAEAPYRFPQTPAMNVMQARASPWKFNLPAALWLVRKRAGIGSGEWQAFDRAERAKAVHCPILVLHGSDDTICPRADASSIAAAAPKATLVEIPGARHNDMWTKEASREQATHQAAAFLRSLVVTPPEPDDRREASWAG
jgi:pimeloyl-ACP methyl ester carboxylesterase